MFLTRGFEEAGGRELPLRFPFIQAAQYCASEGVGAVSLVGFGVDGSVGGTDAR